MDKMAGEKSKQVRANLRLSKAADSILFLMVGQLAGGLAVLILFVVSFVSSPLRPLVWAQVAAVSLLIIGGIALVTVIVVKYRKEIVQLFSRK